MLPEPDPAMAELNGFSPDPIGVVGGPGKSAGGSPAGRVDVRISPPPAYVATAWPWSNATSGAPRLPTLSTTVGVVLHVCPTPARRKEACISGPWAAQMATARPLSSSEAWGFGQMRFSLAINWCEL